MIIFYIYFMDILSGPNTTYNYFTEITKDDSDTGT